MCTQKKNHEKRIKKKEIFVYSNFFLYLCAVNVQTNKNMDRRAILYRFLRARFSALKEQQK